MDAMRLSPEVMKYIFLYLLIVGSISNGIAQTIEDKIYKMETELIIPKIDGPIRQQISPKAIEMPEFRKLHITGINLIIEYDHTIESYHSPHILLYVDSEDFLFSQLLRDFDDTDSDIIQQVIAMTSSNERKSDIELLTEYFKNPETVLEIIRLFDLSYEANLEYNVNPYEVKIRYVDHQFFVYFQFQ